MYIICKVAADSQCLSDVDENGYGYNGNGYNGNYNAILLFCVEIDYFEQLINSIDN